jgi:murein DD-endopeptidase MepM/ murein hydrolase activator NlpD
MIEEGGRERLAHLLNISVNADETVEKGEVIGRSDDTGDLSEGDHIHLELYWNKFCFASVRTIRGR